uniref:Uncharacterized protein n=1 Tax=Anguilla anguilla TaxID=7936 RepID=A0A0E9R9P1_ANGAN
MISLLFLCSHQHDTEIHMSIQG